VNFTDDRYGVYGGTTTAIGSLSTADDRSYNKGSIAPDDPNIFKLAATEDRNNFDGDSETIVTENGMAAASDVMRFGKEGSGGVVADGPNILKWAGGGGAEDDGPRFDDRLPTVMTVAAGQTAALRCRVFGLGNKTVSGVRCAAGPIFF
jgi:hypothetical protein